MGYSNFFEIFANTAVLSAFFGWLLAQTLKVPIHRLVHGELDWKRFFGSGGMPSSHSASVCAATVSIGMVEGFDAPLFALAGLLSMIVMTDAAGVRQAAGKHAKLLNSIVETLIEQQPLTDDKLKEWIGHTPFEVIVGALLGIGVGVGTTLLLNPLGI